MITGTGENEYGTPATFCKCDTCGRIYTVVPVIDDKHILARVCTYPECDSYDPSCDVDLLFDAGFEGCIQRRPTETETDE